VKNIIKLLTIFLTIFYCSISFAENKIAYIDIDLLMIKSKAGKFINDQVQSTHKSNIKKFKEMEEKLKSQEKKIIAQKNILQPAEFEKKISDLRIQANEYRMTRQKEIDKLNKKRLNATSSLIKELNPLIAKYSNDNSISLIIQKKNIVMGKTELDITNDVLKILDKKIQKIDIK
tara:strand:- start:132 stop:656 length:525 start_codon:yes stop_codon:yes gene_type:complete